MATKKRILLIALFVAFSLNAQYSPSGYQLHSGGFIQIPGNPTKQDYFVACAEGGSISDMAELLADKQVTINGYSRSGNTALSGAIGSMRHENIGFLLEHGADVNKNTSFKTKFNGLTPLMAACDRRRTIITYPDELAELVKYLLQKGANPKSIDGTGKTALHYLLANRGDAVTATKLLLKAGADVNAVELEEGWTPLLTLAAKSDDFDSDVPQLLIKAGAKINAVDKDNQTALFFASVRDNPELVLFLLGNGANKYIKNYKGGTAFDVAPENTNTSYYLQLSVFCEKLKKAPDPKAYLLEIKGNVDEVFLDCVKLGDSAAVAKLIQAGANLSLKDENDMSSLWLAIANNYTKVASLLIDKGAMEITDSGTTALMYASSFGNIDIVKKLIKKGVDIAVKNADGNTALLLACDRGYSNVVNLLILNGADIQANNGQGYTSLMLGARYKDVVELLIKRGLNVNEKKADDGWTALMDACSNADTNVINILIKNGADINAKMTTGWTPLLIAANNNRKDNVELLIKKKALVNEKNIDRKNALDIATEKGYVDIVELLKKNGAVESSTGEQNDTTNINQ